MSEFKVIEIKKNILEDNDREADVLRSELKADRTFLLNLMSSPGSGKTTTLVRTIGALKDEMRIGVMEADIDSDVDADTIAQTGAKAIQIHTGGMCHLDADMTRQGIESLETKDVDLAILENVGNLVCPAEFDTGAVKNAMILSVPEGDDKPLKYPLMFSICDVLLINKIDVLPYFDFDIEACKERVKKLNPNIQIIPISSRTGEGMDAWYDWLRTEVKQWNNKKLPEAAYIFYGYTQAMSMRTLRVRTIYANIRRKQTRQNKKTGKTTKNEGKRRLLWQKKEN